jgi:hypothetical protein
MPTRHTIADPAPTENRRVWRGSGTILINKIRSQLIIVAFTAAAVLITPTIHAQAKTFTVTIANSNLEEITNTGLILGSDNLIGETYFESGNSKTPTEYSYVNDQGDGVYIRYSYGEHGLVSSPTLVVGGSQTVLTLPSRPGAVLDYVSAAGINDSDVVLLDAIYTYMGTNEVEASVNYSYSNGVYDTLFQSSETFSEPKAINDLGQVVGSTSDVNYPYSHGYIDYGGGLQTFNVPGAIYTSPLSLNDLGGVVGIYESANFTYSGFVESGGTFSDLNDPLALPGTTIPESINDSGVVVGYYETDTYLDPPGYQGGDFPSYHGFVYDDGVFTTVDFSTEVVTLAPVPEPATWAMMLIGIGGLGAALRSRGAPLGPGVRAIKG